MVYDNKLYSGQTSGDNTARIYSYDGNAWNDTGLNVANASVLSLARYKSKLYAGIGIELPNTGGASIWEYDGTSWRSSKDFLVGDASAVYAMTIFNGKLYAGTGRGVGTNDARLFEYDGSSWTPRATFLKDGIYSLAEYQKELYIGLGGGGDNDGEIWKWTQSGGPSIVEPGAVYKSATHSLSAYSGTLYAGWSDATPPGEIRKLEAAWTLRATPSSNAWRSVAYGNGLFVAVANSGMDNRVMTSSNGIDWTLQTSANDYDWISVAYGNNTFVAVANSGNGEKVMTSSDNGSTWVSHAASDNDNNWRSVTYGNGLFVAVADSGTNRVMISSDNGSTWDPRTGIPDNVWRSVTYGNGLFVAVACGVEGSTACNPTDGDRVIISSDNGSTWTSAVSANMGYWNSVTYGNGLFVAVSGSGAATDRVMTSPNGSNWTLRVSPNTSPNNNWNSVTYGNGLFVAVSVTAVGSRVMMSPDGINWSLKLGAYDRSWPAVTYGNGLFVAVSNMVPNERVMTYKATWIPSDDSIPTEEVRAIYPYMGKLYAATRGTAIADATIRSYGNNGYVGSQKIVWYPNTWYHIAGIYDGTNSVMNLMINGHLSATTSSGVPGTLLNNSNLLYIGSGYNSDPFDGALDSFAVYNNTALSADTIASHAGCYNLGQYLVPEYMGSLPIDPSSTVTDGTDTGYFISKDTGGVITITAPLTEITSSIPEIIKASR